MIEKIELEKCTSCGICDDVCPADVIHMEPVEVAPEIDVFDWPWWPDEGWYKA